MRTAAAIDIGTNSVRLGVHRISQDHHYTTLALHKEVVRLGQGEFAHHRITHAAMERGLVVLREFADIARRYEATEIVAVGTAALREAENRAEFVERAKAECGLDIKIVSGLEEARLIYLGVSSGVDLNGGRALFVDIGGGTTELIVGDAREHFYLESVKLGAIRLGDMFVKNEKGPISRKRYRTMLDYVRGAAGRVFRNAREAGFSLAFGSSGTIMNLAEITARRVGSDVTSIRNYRLTYDDLGGTISMLCGLDLDARRNVPGINPERADIIVSGAAVLDAVMSDTGADSIVISDRALRDGILVDCLFREDAARESYMNTSPRQRSISELCRSCRFEEAHANHVAGLADSIFLQLRDLGLHSYGEPERELLRYASLVHDVGTFVSSGDHHKHSYYLVRNWNLLGFSDEEIEVIATTAMCHRKAAPRKAAQAKLSGPTMSAVELLSSTLRVADALDRSQLGLVREVMCHHDPAAKRLSLEVFAAEGCPLEMWWLESKKELLEETLGVRVRVRLIVGPNSSSPAGPE